MNPYAPGLTFTELQSYNASTSADQLLGNSRIWTGEISAELALDHLFAALHKERERVSPGSVRRAVDLLRRQADSWEAAELSEEIRP